METEKPLLFLEKMLVNELFLMITNKINAMDMENEKLERLPCVIGLAASLKSAAYFFVETMEITKCDEESLYSLLIKDLNADIIDFQKLLNTKVTE